MRRQVKTYSERGSLASIKHRQENPEEYPSEEPLTPMENRLQKLYNIALATKDKDLENSLGFISFENYNGDKSALPTSIFRLREIVSDISSRTGSQIKEMRQELEGCFTLPELPMKKTASSRKRAVFRRVS